jgi:hypothetical protein
VSDPLELNLSKSGLSSSEKIDNNQGLFEYQNNMDYMPINLENQNQEIVSELPAVNLTTSDSSFAKKNNNEPMNVEIQTQEAASLSLISINTERLASKATTNQFQSDTCTAAFSNDLFTNYTMPQRVSSFLAQQSQNQIQEDEPELNSSNNALNYNIRISEFHALNLTNSDPSLSMNFDNPDPDAGSNSPELNLTKNGSSLSKKIDNAFFEDQNKKNQNQEKSLYEPNDNSIQMTVENPEQDAASNSTKRNLSMAQTFSEDQNNITLTDLESLPTKSNTNNFHNDLWPAAFSNSIIYTDSFTPQRPSPHSAQNKQNQIQEVRPTLPKLNLNNVSLLPEANNNNMFKSRELNLSNMHSNPCENNSNVTMNTENPNETFTYDLESSLSCSILNRAMSNSQFLDIPSAQCVRKRKCLRLSESNSDQSADDDQVEEIIRPNLKSLAKKTKSMTTLDSSMTSVSTIHINQLPYEILFQIFEHLTLTTIRGDLTLLDDLRFVCKHWFRVGSDPRLWHHITFSKILRDKSLLDTTGVSYHNFIQRFITNTINQDKRRFQFIQTLDLSPLSFLTCDTLKLLLENCNPNNNLTSLILAKCEHIYLSDQSDLQVGDMIAQYCPKLKKLDLSGHAMPKKAAEKTTIFNSLINLFSTISTTLIDLSIDANLKSIFGTIFESCKNLESLEITHNAPLLLNNLELPCDLSNFSKLKKLRLLNCMPKIKHKTMQDVMLSTVDFAHLEEFSFFFRSFSFDHLLIAKIFKDSTSLRKITIRSYKSPLSDNNLFGTASSNPVESLILPKSSLSEADNEGLVHSIKTKWYSTLISIDLSNSNIKKESINEIFITLIQNPTTCKLISLNLSGTCVDTDQILELMDIIKTIQTLNLTSCRSVKRNLKKELSREEFFANMRN